MTDDRSQKCQFHWCSSGFQPLGVAVEQSQTSGEPARKISWLNFNEIFLLLATGRTDTDTLKGLT